LDFLIVIFNVEAESEATSQQHLASESGVDAMMTSLSATSAASTGVHSAPFSNEYDASFAGLDVTMAFKDMRIQSFYNQQVPWPFLEDCNCTPERVS